jgi:glycosyltransferase involved in cell wall biosynthesis
MLAASSGATPRGDGVGTAARGDASGPSALVSCVVTVFNGQRYLAEALDSVFAQTHRPLEVIVADDGSTDGSARVVVAYGERVRYLAQPTAGPAATRNLGLRAAGGAFVAFLDHDDVWHPEKLSRQLARFEARPELAVSVTEVRHWWVAELADEAARFRDHRIGGALPGYYASTLLARRRTFDAVGGFDPGLFHSDAADWFLRALAHGATLELLPEVLVQHRMHATNLSRRHASETRDEFLQLLKRTLDRRRRAAPDPSGA